MNLNEIETMYMIIKTDNPYTNGSNESDAWNLCCDTFIKTSKEYEVYKNEVE